jgi:hypothetical protein
VGGVLTPANPSDQPARNLGDEPAPSPRAEQSGPATNDTVTSDAVASVKQIVGPLSNALQPAAQPAAQPATQPAMAMLTSLLPKG